MERMADGQDSWARWKSLILALTPDQSSAYLRDVEGFDSERIERLLRGEEAAIVPADWAVSDASKAALARYEAWEERSAAPILLAQQEARSAALPNQHHEDR